MQMNGLFTFILVITVLFGWFAGYWYFWHGTLLALLVAFYSFAFYLLVDPDQRKFSLRILHVLTVVFLVYLGYQNLLAKSESVTQRVEKLSNEWSETVRPPAQRADGIVRRYADLVEGKLLQEFDRKIAQLKLPQLNQVIKDLESGKDILSQEAREVLTAKLAIARYRRELMAEEAFFKVNWQNWAWLYPDWRFVLIVTLILGSLGIALVRSTGNLNYWRWVGGAILVILVVFLIGWFFDKNLNIIAPPIGSSPLAVTISALTTSKPKTPEIETVVPKASSGNSLPTWLRNCDGTVPNPFNPRWAYEYIILIFLLLFAASIVYNLFWPLSYLLTFFAIVAAYGWWTAGILCLSPDGKSVVTEIKEVPANDARAQCAAIGYAEQLECLANFGDLQAVKNSCAANGGVARYRVSRTENVYEVPMWSHQNIWMSSLTRATNPECKHMELFLDAQGPWLPVVGLPGYTIPVPQGTMAKEARREGSKVVFIDHHFPFATDIKTEWIQYVPTVSLRVHIILPPFNK